MTTTAPAGAIDLSRISLRHQERGLVCGGVDSGKSTLCDMLGADFVTRYRARGGRRLILDSKPRYRAEWTAGGRSAARRYRRWGHGQAIPGSVVVDDPADLELAWRTGARTVIVQCEDDSELPRLVHAAKLFLRSSRSSRPQLLQVDETLDFFHSNGSPRGGTDTISKGPRAGRERGTSTLYGSQRTMGLPGVLISEVSRVYCLRMDYVADVKRLREAGCPPFAMPETEHVFRYWWKGDYRRVWGPYRLALPEHRPPR